jgi:hypothetical protein
VHLGQEKRRWAAIHFSFKKKTEKQNSFGYDFGFPSLSRMDNLFSNGRYLRSLEIPLFSFFF